VGSVLIQIRPTIFKNKCGDISGVETAVSKARTEITVSYSTGT
jgi:hypothetical protein